MIVLGLIELIIVALIIFGFLWAIWVVVIKTGKGSRGSRHLHENETRMMQEIFDGLAHMEHRVETLETLLLDKGRDV